MEETYEVLIVGGGPAGFTAGIYCSRANLKTLLLEGATSVSQITLTDIVENYPGFPEGIGGIELMEKFRLQATNFGLEISTADVKSITKAQIQNFPAWQVVTDKNTYLAFAVIIATGARWRRLNVPGEEAFIGRGVSYCATCDAPLFRNQEVVVVGGGDTAVQEALFLTQFARQVYLVHRRNRLRAAGILKNRALQNPRIKIIWDSVVEEIKGKEGVEEVILRHLPTGALHTLSVSGIFVFIGLDPNTEWVKGLLPLSENGAIVVDREMKTSQTGIFACGDCTDKRLRQVVTACGDGATAAYSAQLYVEKLKGEGYPR